jgi:hypothetical protein
MRVNRYCFTVLALACAVSLFLACSTGGGDPNLGGTEKTLPGVSLSSVDGTKYYSLSTGEEITGEDINTDKWDIAFSRTRLILTNSGDTAEALSSGGKGGVWYTDKTVLSNVAFGEQQGDDDPILKTYTTDKVRYTSMDMGGGPVKTKLTLNIMSYVGYRNEDTAAGTEDDPFTSTDPENANPYMYNKKEYYASSGMPPVMTGTDQVYIICHGDGEHYSKIQIAYEYIGANADEGTPAKDAWGIRYQNF